MKCINYLKILSLFFICLFVSSCGSGLDKNFFMDINNNKVEVYSDIYLYDLISTNAKIINKNEYISTTELGKKKITIEFEYKKKTYTQDIEYEVVDNTSPKIYGNSSKTVYVNSDTDVCKLTMIGDNYDKQPECLIEGEYDLTKIGTYNLTYQVKDSSNNTSSFNFNLKVIEKPKTTNNTSSSNEITNYLDFNEVITNYKTDYTEIGIDVSKWQKEIDFNKVKNSGAEFVIIRIGQHAGIGYDIVEDEYFQQNLKNAKAAGLKIGIYFYSTATTIEDAIEHANWVINKLGGEKIDLPIAFDWENWNYWNYYSMSFYDINIIADVFIQTLNDAGYDGMLYASKSYLETIWTNKKNHPVWLANYNSTTSYAGDYLLWQLSNIGKIDGIQGHVDINVLYK